MDKRIKSKQGEIISSSLSDTCCECILTNTNNGYAQIKCSIDSTNKRIGYISNNSGELLACSNTSKTTKNFKEEIIILASHIPDLLSLRNNVAEKITKDELLRVRRVVHNLKNINAHCIQELYNFIPQDKFTQNLNSTVEIVKSAIKKKNKDAAFTFLRIAKYNLSMKAEFSVYEKLLKDNPKLSPRLYNLRDIIMIVLHMFFGDFTSISVRVVVNEYYEKASIDFESIQVALYHIIENAAKYVKPQSTLFVQISNDGNFHNIEFKMESLHMYPEDIANIFKEGFSGQNAKKTSKAGDGIGMYRAKKLIELNNSDLNVIAGSEIIKYRGLEYSLNKFFIKIPF